MTTSDAFPSASVGNAVSLFHDPYQKRHEFKIRLVTAFSNNL